MEQLLLFDKKLFLALNGCHNPFFDVVMKLASDKFVWVPLYMLILFLFFYKKDWRTGLVAVAGALAVFALCDSVSFFIKNLVERPRPFYDPSLEGMVRLLEDKGGRYGYFSSHAANVFGLAVFSLHYIHKRAYSIPILLWAALVSYSRIYVGKHFPLDVLTGILFGAVLGYAVWILCRFIIRKAGFRF